MRRNPLAHKAKTQRLRRAGKKDNKFTFDDLMHIIVAVVEVFRPEVGAADLGLSLFLGKENSLDDFYEDFYDSQVFGVFVPGYK